MIHSNKKYLVAFFLPVISLILLTAYKQIQVARGTEVILTIQGYDPRDLLSGHYLTFTVNYDLPGLCQNNSEAEKYVCLTPRFESDILPEDCKLYIRGQCRGWRFAAGVERYYVPENEALLLEKLVRNHEASIKLSIGKDGTARIKDLLLNGISWKEVKLEEEKK
jgi:uncharacterized membrane-anchored protein